jgi:signal transduction histidine kinase
LAEFLPAVATRLARLTGLGVVAEPCDATIAAQPGRLQRILLNLCVNAVNVGARHVRLTGEVDDGTLRLRACDDGPGFTPEIAARAFEPGFSTSGGTGLGLPTVRRLVTQLGGTVAAIPDEPGGCVEVRLPLATP